MATSAVRPLKSGLRAPLPLRVRPPLHACCCGQFYAAHLALSQPLAFRPCALPPAALAARPAACVVPNNSYDVVQRSRPPPVPQATRGYDEVAQPAIMAPGGGVSITHYADGSVSTA